MDELHSKLQDVFRQVFDEDDLIISRETTADDVEGWDSMAHINLIVAVEKQFGVKFAAAELASTRTANGSVGGLLDLLSQKTGQT